LFDSVSSVRVRRFMAAVTSSVRKLFAVLVGGALSAFTPACSGIDAGVEYPDDLPEPGSRLMTPEGEADPSITLGEFKISPEACKDVDTRPMTQKLTPEDLTRFLEVQGAKIEPKKARGNLYWYDVPNGKDKGFLRLRLAVLDDAGGASKDLHVSLLEHGPGWWGVRRSNLAVLAPKAGLEEALAFALKYKLPCWGIFTYAGLDDAYVVPGPYSEL
jgi:hypothetical protein